MGEAVWQGLNAESAKSHKLNACSPSPLVIAAAESIGFRKSLNDRSRGASVVMR